MTVSSLAREMSEAEFYGWQCHAAAHPLPTRRIEIYLAQISMLIAKCMGGAKDAKLADFLLFDRASEESALPNDEEAAKAAFGFKPKKKKTES